jgi:hypothetical protein
MALPHFVYIPTILKKRAKKYIKYQLKEIKEAFKNANISLNGQGENLIFLSGRPNFAKEERIESGITYLVYKSFYDETNTHEYYTLNKKLHRENGPAYIFMVYNNIMEYAYFKNGKLHNSEEPAIMTTIQYTKNEKQFAYWYKGKFLTKEKFNIIQRKRKIQNICQKYL